MSRARLQIASIRGTDHHGWRLMSAAAQPMGSGVGTCRTAVACARGLQRLRSSARAAPAGGEPDLVGVQSLDLDSGRWVWRVEQLGFTVAVSCADVDGQRENQAALGHFLAGLRDADVEMSSTWMVLPEPRRVRDLRDVRLLRT